MFTQQHFEAIAATLNGRTKPNDGIAHQVVNETIAFIALDLVELFEADNERFDRARFLAASGISETLPARRAYAKLLEEIDDAGLGRQS